MGLARANDRVRVSGLVVVHLAMRYADPSENHAA